MLRTSAVLIIFGAVVIFLILGIHLQAGKPDDPRDFKIVIKDLAKTLNESNKSDKLQRLAVITFIPTKNGAKASNEFGEYITESLISELTSGKKSFRLFERKRLDDVLKENDLMLSDLMDQSQAMKVGELLPVDVIFSGSYTNLKNYIDINCRLINVVTGEIHVSFSARIKMTDDLASLFPDEEKRDGKEKAKDADAGCKNNSDQIRIMLRDLTTDQKIQKVVDEAVKIPFEDKCGYIHLIIIEDFRKHRIDHPQYKKFLMNTLDTMYFPFYGSRGGSITRYFSVDSVIDDQEWKLGLKAISRSWQNIHYYVRDLFLMTAAASGEKEKDYETQDIVPLRNDQMDKHYSRIDEYFDLAVRNKLGLPVPINFYQAFCFMCDGLKNKTDNRLAMYVYEKYAPKLDMKDDKDKRLNNIQNYVYEFLAFLYENETDKDRKAMQLDWLVAFFNQSEPTDQSARELYRFAYEFEPKKRSGITKLYIKEDQYPLLYPAQDMQKLLNACAAKFSQYALLSTGTAEKDNRILFCIDYDIPIPGVIPTMSEAAEILKGDDWDKKIKTLSFLERMKDKPVPLEEILINIMLKRDTEHKKELGKMQNSAVVILGNIKTADPKAITILVEALDSDEPGVPKKAKTALGQIGKPAVPALIKYLNSVKEFQGSYHYMLVETLGLIGKDASSAKKDLQALLNKVQDRQFRYVIESAIQSME